MVHVYRPSGLDARPLYVPVIALQNGSQAGLFACRVRLPSALAVPCQCASRLSILRSPYSAFSAKF